MLGTKGNQKASSGHCVQIFWELTCNLNLPPLFLGTNKLQCHVADSMRQNGCLTVAYDLRVRQPQHVSVSVEVIGGLEESHSDVRTIWGLRLVNEPVGLRRMERRPEGGSLDI